MYNVVAFLITFVMTFWKCGSPEEYLNERKSHVTSSLEIPFVNSLQIHAQT